MSEQTGTPLTALNAIKLSAREVAATFVAPPSFDDLVHADNAVLTGPRGSGKTTLLKMLQSEALENWTALEGRDARAAVRAVGVFVGSDRTWNEQLAMRGDSLGPLERQALTRAAFTTHILRAIVAAMDFRLRGPAGVTGEAHKRVDPTSVDEAALAVRLSGLAGFDHGATSLPSLGDLLADRFVQIGQMRNQLRRRVAIVLPTWVDVDPLNVADAMVEAFNVAAHEPDQKWALLFDELELAPKTIVEELLGSLRGAQPRLLFKLSLAPANVELETLGDEHAPVPGQDYEHVTLTYARKLPALKFAKALAQATVEHASGTSRPPVERLLGSGRLDSRDEFEGEEVTPTRAYEVGSPLWKTLVALRDRDQTFAEYLTRNNIDLGNLEALPPARRAARLRKVRNIVVVREYFRGDDGHRRSRKSSSLYTGADSILSLPDGNPRMVIALVRQLFPGVGYRPGDRVSTPAQSSAIEITLNRFLALLEAQQAVNVNGRAIGVMELVDTIGNSLAARLVEAPFSENFALTFKVSTNIRPEIHRLLVRGINAGAFIHVPPRNGASQLGADIYGKHYRLSHLLATKFGLPIHLTPAASLSDHLPAEWLMDAHPKRPTLPQDEVLFENDEHLDDGQTAGSGGGDGGRTP